MDEKDHNRKAYDSRQAIRAYSSAGGLTLQEELCLGLVPKARRRSVLDMGIGGGRTSEALCREFSEYVGFDYSPSQVEMAKHTFPALDIRLMDARDFEFNRQFDCLFFSFNGIDYVLPQDRLKILERVASHTAKGGYFIYSTHNLAFKRVQPWLNRLFVAEIVHPRRWMILLSNRLRNFWKQRDNTMSGWALLNDPGLRFGLLTVYVDMEKEQQLLKRYGFETVAIIGNGKRHFIFDADDVWVNIVARKIE